MKIVQDIWHGDSVELLQRFHAKRNIKTILTDPPFGINNQSNQSKTAEGKKYARKIANDESPEVAMDVFTRVTQAFLPAMQDESDIYIFTSYHVLAEWLQFSDSLLLPHGYKRRALLVWKKAGPGMGDLSSSWGMGVEFILYYKRGVIPSPGKRRNGVIEGPQIPAADLIHPHEKPAWLLQLLAKQSTNEGDLLVDPFGGSGSLARAMRPINRSAVSIELDETNYKLARKAFDESEEGLF